MSLICCTVFLKLLLLLSLVSLIKFKHHPKTKIKNINNRNFLLICFENNTHKNAKVANPKSKIKKGSPAVKPTTQWSTRIVSNNTQSYRAPINPICKAILCQS